MAVEITGSSFLGEMYADSVSITVPEDADIAIIYGKDYATPTGVPLIGTTATTLITRSPQFGSYEKVGIYYLVDPPKGSQTLYCRETDGFSDLYYYGASFFKGVDKASPIVDYDATVDTDITGMTFNSGDMMVGAAGGAYAAVTVTDNSQTQLVSEGSHGFGVAYRANVGDFYSTCTDCIGVVAAVIKAAAASSTGLPRRALDGPLYGSLRGSVR